MPFSLTSEGRSLGNRGNSNEQSRIVRCVNFTLTFDLDSDYLSIEKQNLLAVFKLVIKDLLDRTLKREHVLDKEHFYLRHFFIVFEHILYHGYSGKKSFPLNSSANRKDLWPLIDLISRKSTDNSNNEISISIKDMSNIRTSLGRVRAWFRLALMQKHLADYFKILCEQRQELNDWYDQQALLLADENVIIHGLLLGLNVLDFNFCLKEINLDYPIESWIYYSIYLDDRSMVGRGDIFDEFNENSSIESSSLQSPSNDQSISLINTSDGMSGDSSYDQRVSNILDQKNYLEELNRHLQ